VSAATAPTTGAPSDRRAWLALAVLTLPTLLASLDLTILSLAVPAISADLAPSGPQLLWIVDVYGFVLGGCLVTMGALGDRIGRRRLLLIGAAAFGATSVLAAFAPSAELLIAARALMGVAGATLMPSTLSLASTLFADERRRTTAIGAVIASFSAGTALGPLVGGALLEHFWWGSVFLASVPAMVLLLVVGPRLLPERHGERTAPLDLASAALSLVAILALVYALKRAAYGDPDAAALAALLGGLAAAAVFVRRQRRLADPFLDLGLFRRRAFSVALGALVIGFVVLFAAYYVVGQQLQLVLGLSPLEAGLLSAPSAAGVILGSTLAPRLVRRVRPGFVVGAGMGLSALGFALLAQVEASSGVALVVVASVTIATGLGPMMTIATDLVVRSAPPPRAGAAAALSETCGDLGGALGVAVLGSVAAAAYRSALDGTLPAGVPDAAATAARDTLGGALSAADGLPGAVARALSAGAREAFVHAVHVTAIVGGVTIACAAVAIAVLLRDVPALGAGAPSDAPSTTDGTPILGAPAVEGGEGAASTGGDMGR
jgi:MFS transporter, DHA2 family, multidrug resistance protein